MDTRKNLLVAWGSIFLLCMLTPWIRVFSQEDTLKKNLADMSLEELFNIEVTTASKVAQNVDKAPATVIVITEEQIRNRGYQSLLDVMYDLPDVKVDDKMYSNSRNNVSIRGIQGQDKFLIMLDGVLISSPTHEALPIMENYPVNFARQIEIIFGPASALYGPDAVSGIINIISKKLDDSKKTAITLSSSADGYRQTNTSFYWGQRLSEDVTLTLSTQYLNDPGVDYSKLYKDNPLLDMTSHRTKVFNSIYGLFTVNENIRAEYESPLSAYNFLASLKAGNFTISYFRNYAQNSTALENNTNNAVYNRENFMGQATSTISANYTKEFGNFLLTSTVSQNTYRINPQSRYQNLYVAFQPAYKYAYSQKLHFEQQVNWEPTAKFNLIGGATLDDYFAVPQSTDLDGPVDDSKDINGIYLGTKAYYRPEGLAATFYPFRYSNYGTFLQARYALSDAFDFTLGSRYDYNTRYGSTINPRLGLVSNPTETTNIKILFGTAFLSPSPSFFYAQWGSFYTSDSGMTYSSYFLHLPNPNLKPIYSKTTEFSFRQCIDKNWSIALEGYYSNITNQYNTVPDNGNTNLYHNQYLGWKVDYVEVIINQLESEIYGASLLINHSMNLKNGKIKSYVSISYSDGFIENQIKNKEYDQQLDFISPWMIHAGTSLRIGKLTFSPRLIWSDRQRISGFKDTTNPIVRQTIPGYVLLNVHLMYQVSKKITVFVKATNVLNQKYVNVGYGMDLYKKPTELYYGQPEDPIRIMGGITLSL